MTGSVEKSRPKEEPPLPPATPLVAAPEKRRPEKRPGESKGEEKADVREEVSGGKTDLPTQEGEHELEISLKISAGRRLDEPSRPPLEGEEGLLSPTRPPGEVESVSGSVEKPGPRKTLLCHLPRLWLLRLRSADRRNAQGSARERRRQTIGKRGGQARLLCPTQRKNTSWRSR